MRDLIIVGTGGVGRALRQFAEDCNAVAPRWRIPGFVDDATRSLDRPCRADARSADRLREFATADVLVGVGAPAARMKVVERLRALADPAFPALVHPRAYLPAGVPVGEGAIVYPGACVEIDARLGAFVIINHNATIGDDTVLADFATVGPGCAIGGNIVVGAGAFLGIGACTVQGITIGNGAIVGAGAAVTGDVGAGLTVVGVSARPRPRRMSVPTPTRLSFPPPTCRGASSTMSRKPSPPTRSRRPAPSAAFEQAFADYVGIPHAVALASGTAAIHLALRMLDAEAGPRSLDSSLTFIGGVGPIAYERLAPVFFDCDPATWCLDPGSSPRRWPMRRDEGRLPAAVIPVDLYGQCADLDAILAICRRMAFR